MTTKPFGESVNSSNLISINSQLGIKIGELNAGKESVFVGIIRKYGESTMDPGKRVLNRESRQLLENAGTLLFEPEKKVEQPIQRKLEEKIIGARQSGPVFNTHTPKRISFFEACSIIDHANKLLGTSMSMISPQTADVVLTADNNSWQYFSRISPFPTNAILGLAKGYGDIVYSSYDYYRSIEVTVRLNAVWEGSKPFFLITNITGKDIKSLVHKPGQGIYVEMKVPKERLIPVVDFESDWCKAVPPYNLPLGEVSNSRDANARTFTLNTEDWPAIAILARASPKYSKTFYRDEDRRVISLSTPADAFAAIAVEIPRKEVDGIRKGFPLPFVEKSLAQLAQ